MSQKQDQAKERVLAMLFNNRGWDLWEAQDASDELLHAAHAAYALWERVGGPVNELRALVLLAYAHARQGSAELALRFARKAEQLMLRAPEGMADWDGPFVLDAMSRAHEAAGEADRAEEYRVVAESGGKKIADEGDRDYFMKTFERYREGVAG